MEELLNLTDVSVCTRARMFPCYPTPGILIFVYLFKKKCPLCRWK